MKIAFTFYLVRFTDKDGGWRSAGKGRARDPLDAQVYKTSTGAQQVADRFRSIGAEVVELRAEGQAPDTAPEDHP